MKTFNLKEQQIEKKWYVIDAEGVVLGRLASSVSLILRGKNKPTYTPYLDCGDYVIIVNAAKILYKGVAKDKLYHRYSGYPGGIKTISLEKVLKTKPERAIMGALKGMLSRTPLGRKQLTNVRVFAGPEHPHAAQKPETLKLSL